MDGRSLFDDVQQRLRPPATWAAPAAQPYIGRDRYGAEYLTRPRLGQGAFRVLVTDAYERRCALTGERTLPVLEAAHIKPYSEAGDHDLQNGLLMRSDIHKLYDRGYITVRPDLTIDVSTRIASEYSNGLIYYALQDKPLSVIPARASEQPDRELLDWHGRHVFQR